MTELAVKETNLPASLDAESIIMKAIESNTPVEQLERLLAMRDNIMREQARQAFFAALSSFQSKCPVIQKNKQVKNKDGSVRYAYATLDHIAEKVMPILDQCGLSYSIKTETRDGHVIATCEVRHLAGHIEKSEFAIPIDSDGFMNDAQKAGSALTYAKRYAFCNAFGIMTGDSDDDAQAMGQGISINEVYKKATIHMATVMEHIDTVLAVKKALLEGDLDAAAEAWAEIDDAKTISALSLAPTKGGCFTVDERKLMKEREFGDAVAKYRPNGVTGL